MDTTNYRANMEVAFSQLGDMKLTQKQRAQIAGIVSAAFINGFHAALAEYFEISESKRDVIVADNDTAQHIIFLARQNSI